MQNNNKVIGYTTGVFDLFHIGHLNILKNAKDKCDKLIVGVTTDEITLKMKGRYPVIPFEERIEIIEGIKFVDSVYKKDNIDNMIAWNEFKFHKYFKGDDWKGTIKGDKLEMKFKAVGVEIIYFSYTKTTSSTIIREIIENLKINSEYEV